MRIMWTAARSLILFLVPLACFGQLSPQAKAIFQAASVPKVVSGGGGESWPTGYPTNLTSPVDYHLAVNGWWCPGSNYSSSSGLATLANLSFRGSILDFTNKESGTAWQPTLATAHLNGLDTLTFGGAFGVRTNYLEWTDASNFRVVSEIVMVCAITNVGDFTTFFDGTAGRQLLAFNDSKLFEQFAGAAMFPAASLTNKWIVLNVIFNSTSSLIYTNGVASATGSSGGSSINSMRLGADYQKNFCAGLQLAEMIQFTNTTLGAADSAGTFTASVARSNLFHYFTNKYAIAP